MDVVHLLVNIDGLIDAIVAEIGSGMGRIVRMLLDALVNYMLRSLQTASRFWLKILREMIRWGSPALT